MKSPVIVKISWSWKLFNFIIQFVFLFIVNIFVSGWVLDGHKMNFRSHWNLFRPQMTLNLLQWWIDSINWQYIFELYVVQIWVVDWIHQAADWNLLMLHHWLDHQSAVIFWLKTIWSIFSFALEIQKLNIYRHWYRGFDLMALS